MNKECIERFNLALGTEVPIKAKLEYTNNDNFKHYTLFQELDIMFYHQMILIPSTLFSSSYIKKIEYRYENKFIIYTRNSIYIFEILDIEFLSWYNEGIIFEMSDEDYLNGDYR